MTCLDSYLDHNMIPCAGTSSSNEAKKKKSRMGSLLKKAEELHRLHHLGVLVVLYDLGKDSLTHYCSGSAQEMCYTLLGRLPETTFPDLHNRPSPLPSPPKPPKPSLSALPLPRSLPVFLCKSEPDLPLLKPSSLDIEICSTKESSRPQESIRPPGSPTYLSPHTSSTPDRRKETESESEDYKTLDWLAGM